MTAASDSAPAEAPFAALDTVPRLRTAVLRLTYRAEDRVHLPSPPASVWRGQLGHFLHRIAPDAHHENDLSLYQRLFRTPASAVGVPDHHGRTLGRIGLAGEHVPHPFVMRMTDPLSPGASLTLTPAETVEVEMVLIEDTVQHLPQLAAAFEALGTGGFGQKTDQPRGPRRRGSIRLTDARLDLGGVQLALYEGQAWSLPPDCTTGLYDQAAALAPEPDHEGDTAGGLTVTFQTPCRLKHRGSILRPPEMTAGALGAPLARRILGLAVCYGPETPSESVLEAQLEAFYALAEATTLDTTDLRWTSDTRYSHRQERTHPVGGITGTLSLGGPAEVQTAWRRWLRPATRVHLGKKTALGRGRIALGGDG